MFTNIKRGQEAGVPRAINLQAIGNQNTFAVF